MKPLTLDDLVDLETYEVVRPAFRERIVAYKRERRLAVGDRVTLVFENRETIRYQVHEMARVERLREPDKLLHELEVYNELIPGEGELSATLFIEITDLEAIRPELDRLVGIDEHVSLRLGAGAGERRLRARFDPKQLDEERIAAVQYIRFALGPDEQRALRDPGVPAAIAIDHPNYRAEAALPPALRASLVADLEGEPEPWLGLPLPRAGAGGLARRQGLRVRELAAPQGRMHRVVEAEGAGSLLDLDPERLAELIVAVREVARELVAARGSCRIELEVPGESTLRWHLHAPAR